MATLNNYKKFDRQTEQLLFIKYRNGDQDAYHLLIKSQMPWAIKQATRYCKIHQWHDMDLAVCGAYYGVLLAVAKFDHTKGTRLVTYTTVCINKEIQKEHKKAREKIDVPSYLDRESMMDHKFQKYTKKKFEILDLSSIVDRSMDHGSVDHGSVDHKQLKDAMLQLTGREQYIIKQRYYHDKTLREISKVMNLSRERIRQIQYLAINKLRKNMKHEYVL